MSIRHNMYILVSPHTRHPKKHGKKTGVLSHVHLLFDHKLILLRQSDHAIPHRGGRLARSRMWRVFELKTFQFRPKIPCLAGRGTPQTAGIFNQGSADEGHQPKQWTKGKIPSKTTSNILVIKFDSPPNG